MRDWLASASLPSIKELSDDLCAPLYEYSLSGQLKLESKDKMKRRGFASPDFGDALALTFSRTVGRKDGGALARRKKARVARDVDYDVFG